MLKSWPIYRGQCVYPRHQTPHRHYPILECQPDKGEFYGNRLNPVFSTKFRKENHPRELCYRRHTSYLTFETLIHICYLKQWTVTFNNRTMHNHQPLRWRHNGRDSVSNHQPHHCLFNRLFRRRSKRTSKLRVTSLCVGNSPGTGEFPSLMASNAENVSIWWRHHATKSQTVMSCSNPMSSLLYL